MGRESPDIAAHSIGEIYSLPFSKPDPFSLDDLQMRLFRPDFVALMRQFSSR
jgi:hypothetical protein